MSLEICSACRGTGKNGGVISIRGNERFPCSYCRGTGKKIPEAMQDITGSGEVEIKIRNDGNVIWVNTMERQCVLRICMIKKLNLVDERPKAAD